VTLRESSLRLMCLIGAAAVRLLVLPFDALGGQRKVERSTKHNSSFAFATLLTIDSSKSKNMKREEVKAQMQKRRLQRFSFSAFSFA
jgi:hypothetical protein